MGVYSTNNSYSSFETGAVIECTYDSPMEAALIMVAEGETNYNRIMQAIGIDELAVLESTGSEIVYEAVDIKAIWGKIKQFFVNLFNKIKGLFQKFMAMINSWVAKDKDFVKKYRKQLTMVNTKGFEYQGYVFTNLNLEINKVSDGAKAYVEKEAGSTFDKATEASGDSFIKAADNKADILDGVRGDIIGEGPTESGDFYKELFKYFRNKEDSKDDIGKSVNVNNLLSLIDGAAETKKAAEKQFKEVEDAFKKYYKIVEDTEKKLIKEVPETDNSIQIRNGSAAMQFMKDVASVVTVVNGAKLQALKDQNRQAKAICVKLLNYTPKNEGFVHTEGASFLDNVVFK